MPPDDKVALITGITGQDGSYLCELLLDRGYQVHGLIRRASSFNTGRIDHLYQDPHVQDQRLFLHYGDMTDGARLQQLVASIRPTELYNLAAQSHVQVSFQMPDYTAQVNALGVVRLLEAIRSAGLVGHTRLYQASTSELFGRSPDRPQHEGTPFYPRSPYAIAKLHAHWQVINHREAYGLFACNGLLFNHESPRRGKTFVSRKITLGAAAIASGRQQTLFLGNLDARRDWGYAPEYVEAMWQMLQQDQPRDLVIATGQAHTVRQFAQLAFQLAGLPLRWEGQGLHEQGLCATSGRILIQIDPRYVRPAEADALIGDASQARRLLGWAPRTSFEDLVRLMVEHDLRNTQPT